MSQVFLKKVARKIEVFINSIYLKTTEIVPFLRPIHETYSTQTPITISMWFMQKVIGFNRQAYWPMHFTSQLGNFRNIYVGIESSPGYMPGCYIQGEAKTYIGDYTQIATNVGIINANHDCYENCKHTAAHEVSIGNYCWIGMNTVILPGVKLGDHTTVGANSVVTKSFVEGYCVIAGNPARKIKNLDPSLCIKYKSQYEYHGYIAHHLFEKYRSQNLNI